MKTTTFYITIKDGNGNEYFTTEIEVDATKKGGFIRAISATLDEWAIEE
jgi:hypothetical protein